MTKERVLEQAPVLAVNDAIAWANQLNEMSLEELKMHVRTRKHGARARLCKEVLEKRLEE